MSKRDVVRKDTLGRRPKRRFGTQLVCTKRDVVRKDTLGRRPKRRFGTQLVCTINVGRIQHTGRRPEGHFHTGRRPEGRFGTSSQKHIRDVVRKDTLGRRPKRHFGTQLVC